MALTREYIEQFLYNEWGNCRLAFITEIGIMARGQQSKISLYFFSTILLGDYLYIKLTKIYV